MKKLNGSATRIFLRLLQKIKEQEYIKLRVEGFMPLSLERLYKVETPFGTGNVYSLNHTYEQNGDLMRDPEMCFIVVTGVDEHDTSIYPQLYRQDNLGLYEESVQIENGHVIGYITIWQHGHASFANQWLKNIQSQGFLK